MRAVSSLTIFLFCLIASGYSQQCVEKFMDQQLKQKNAIAMNLPGWLIRKGGRIGYKYANDNDAREFIKISQYVKKLRFLVIEKEVQLAQSKVDQLLSDLKMEGFEKYLKMRSEEDHVQIIVKEEKDIIKHLLVLVYEPSSLVMVNLKMNLPMDIFDKLHFDPKFE